MLPDVIDDDEYRTGKRREGIFAGFFNICLKLSVTLALTVSNLVFQAVGYVSPKSTCGAVGSASPEPDSDLPDEQPENVIFVLRLLAGPVPAALVLVATVFAWSFPITKDALEVMASEAHVRREENVRKKAQLDVNLPETKYGVDHEQE